VPGLARRRSASNGVLTPLRSASLRSWQSPSAKKAEQKAARAEKAEAKGTVRK